MHNEIPYPSIADAGYFLSVIFYILGIFTLTKITGAFIKLRAFRYKIFAVLVPVGMLIVSKYFFLTGYEFDWGSPLRIFLDFGYPLGEAFYVSIAILAIIYSHNTLGGIMRVPLIVLMVALIVQYIAEFNFLVQALNGTWTNGGYGDILYLVSYFIMTISLIRITTAMQKISNQ